MADTQKKEDTSKVQEKAPAADGDKQPNTEAEGEEKKGLSTMTIVIGAAVLAAAGAAAYFFINKDK